MYSLKREFTKRSVFDGRNRGFVVEGKSNWVKKDAFSNLSACCGQGDSYGDTKPKYAKA